MSLDDIWNAYRHSLKRFLYTKVSNPADADDLLQEIMIKTQQGIDALQKEESIQSWLFQIANHVVIDFYRKKKRVESLAEEPLWHSSDSGDVKKTLSHCIEPFLSSLPHSSAELLRAVDLNGVSQKQLAENLGLSYSTLKSRIQKARNELKSVYESCCRFERDQHGNLLDFEAKSGRCNKCD